MELMLLLEMMFQTSIIRWNVGSLNSFMVQKKCYKHKVDAIMQYGMRHSRANQAF
jgi:hypothetical protein